VSAAPGCFQFCCWSASCVGAFGGGRAQPFLCAAAVPLVACVVALLWVPTGDTSPGVAEPTMFTAFPVAFLYPTAHPRSSVVSAQPPAFPGPGWLCPPSLKTFSHLCVLQMHGLSLLCSESHLFPLRLFLSFETVSHYAAQAALMLTKLPRPPECGHYMPASVPFHLFFPLSLWTLPFSHLTEKHGAPRSPKSKPNAFLSCQSSGTSSHTDRMSPSAHTCAAGLAGHFPAGSSGFHPQPLLTPRTGMADTRSCLWSKNARVKPWF
jgi:hypothetical protein